jgi:hypothetical protein
VRSAALARQLKKRGIEAIPIGVDSIFSDETLTMHLDWCDVAYFQKESLAKLVKRSAFGYQYTAAQSMEFGPDRLSQYLKDLAGTQAGAIGLKPEWQAKVDLRFDVGKDDWYQPSDPSLRDKLRAMVEASGLHGDKEAPSG